MLPAPDHGHEHAACSARETWAALARGGVCLSTGEGPALSRQESLLISEQPTTLTAPLALHASLPAMHQPDRPTGEGGREELAELWEKLLVPGLFRHTLQNDLGPVSCKMHDQEPPPTGSAASPGRLPRSGVFRGLRRASKQNAGPTISERLSCAQVSGRSRASSLCCEADAALFRGVYSDGDCGSGPERGQEATPYARNPTRKGTRDTQASWTKRTGNAGLNTKRTARQLWNKVWAHRSELHGRVTGSQPAARHSWTGRPEASGSGMF